MFEKRARTRRSSRETKRRRRGGKEEGGGGEARHLSIALERLRHGDCTGEKRLPSSSFRSVEQATAAAAHREMERGKGERGTGGVGKVWRGMARGMAEILSVRLRLTLKVKYELAWAFN